MKTIIGSWKINGAVDFAKKFIDEINTVDTQNRVVVCPPVGLLHLFKNFKYDIGAQNCFWKNSGAFTGENSPSLLKELGCKYVIAGHSERRALFGESNEGIFKKYEAIVSEKMTAVICIGEKQEERDNWKDVLAKQLEKFSKKKLEHIIFAYEPVWSIGTGLIPSIAEIEIVARFVKDFVGNYPFLYGGSVNSQNSQKILKCNNVDGVLVGAASLEIDEFSKIIG